MWSWFSYVLAANLLRDSAVWLAAHWSLRPIGHLTSQVRELETGHRENLDDNPPQELRSPVRNLNLLLTNERQRYALSHHAVGFDAQPENAAGGAAKHAALAARWQRADHRTG